MYFLLSSPCCCENLEHDIFGTCVYILYFLLSSLCCCENLEHDIFGVFVNQSCSNVVIVNILYLFAAVETSRNRRHRRRTRKAELADEKHDRVGAQPKKPISLMAVHEGLWTASRKNALISQRGRGVVRSLTTSDDVMEEEIRQLAVARISHSCPRWPAHARDQVLIEDSVGRAREAGVRDACLRGAGETAVTRVNLDFSPCCCVTLVSHISGIIVKILNYEPHLVTRVNLVSRHHAGNFVKILR